MVGTSIVTLVLLFITWITGQGIPTEETFACFNTVLDIRCDPDHIIVFDKARYGRNDTVIATRCNTLFTSKCDVDAHFTLNRLCSGKQKCALLVNTELFGDPCGYDEFLKVTYQCIPNDRVASRCGSLSAEPLLDHGYLASPNYPSKYYMDAECVWQLLVQPRQTISITLMDFELDVKRGGFCYDFLEIRTDDHIYFKDCGALGKQVIAISSNRALVRFHTAQSGLTQRGFVIYFQGEGPGCEDLVVPSNGTVTYRMVNDELQALVTCSQGYQLAGTSNLRSKVLHCFGSAWNDTLYTEDCLPPYVPSTAATTSSTVPLPKDSSQMEKSSSVVGLVLGVVSAILLITLLLVLALYLHRRRKKAERKLDEMRVVFNNLQPEPSIAGSAIYKLPMESPYSCPGASSNIRKSKKPKHKNCLEDELQGRNLLATPLNDDEDGDLHKAHDTYPKYYDECRYVIRKPPPPSVLVPPVRRTVHNSKDYLTYDPYNWDEDAVDFKMSGPPPVPPRRARHSRSRSGVWEKQSPECSMVLLTPTKKLITMSAPDLLQGLNPHLGCPDHNRTMPVALDCLEGCYPYPQYTRDLSREHLSHSTTLGHPHGHRTVRKQRSRSSSRVNVRA